MPVTSLSSLGFGVAVNIVLKENQPSGKLTTGKIKDFLTRGDHPRGIKVRLQDGQVGRVQSLATENSSTMTGSAPSTIDSRTPQGFKFQTDIRSQPEASPTREASLEDYIKIKPTKKGKSKKATIQTSPETSTAAAYEDVQTSLEKEFPSLDSSLIAAILSDAVDTETARTTLQSLSTG